VIGTSARLLLATLAVVGGGVMTATTSYAATGPLCVGDTAVESICVTIDPSALPSVDPTGGPGFHDCIFAGPPPCVPVDLPTPSILPGDGGSLVDVQCAGVLDLCPDVTAPGTAVMVGTGNHSPGLTSVPGPQNFTFAGNAVGNVGGGPESFGCTWTGNEIGSVTQGSGSFNGFCGLSCGTVGISGSISRTISEVTLSGSVTTGACFSSSSFSGSCVFVPTTGPTVISYAQVCELRFPS